MRKVKTGIIGIGNMGTAHAINLTENHCPEMELCLLYTSDAADE